MLYLLIMTPVEHDESSIRNVLTKPELDELLVDPGHLYGITRFMDTWPINESTGSYLAPEYWKRGEALVLKAETLVIEPVTTVTKYHVVGSRG